MNDKAKKPDFETEVAVDWYQGITKDLEAMSPGQFAVTRKALADFEAKQKKTTPEQEFNRRVAHANDYELNFYKMHGVWPESK